MSGQATGPWLYAVGDVAPDREDPRECFALVRDTLRRADIAFCQLEVNLTQRGARLPQVRHTHRAGASTAAAIAEAGIHVVSFASNHCLDWGPDGLFDTLDHLRIAELQTLGAGRDIAQARSPVIVTRNGVRVGFLAYCSILPSHYWAESNRPGCAPMRAFTVYEPIEPDQPGTPPRIHTYAHRADLDAMRADIAALKAHADRIVVSQHWGIHFVPAVIADYQREVAHAAIDAGADVILGHHAHILKGAEVYRGKPIFYSVGNFAMDLRMDKAHAESKGFKEIQSLHPEWVPDFDSLYNFPPESRMTMIATLQLNKSGPVQAGFLPCFINRQAQPEVLQPDDARFAQVVAYMREISRQQQLTVDYRVAADRVSIIEPAQEL